MAEGHDADCFELFDEASLPHDTEQNRMPDTMSTQLIRGNRTTLRGMARSIGKHQLGCNQYCSAHKNYKPGAMSSGLSEGLIFVEYVEIKCSVLALGTDTVASVLPCSTGEEAAADVYSPEATGSWALP